MRSFQSLTLFFMATFLLAGMGCAELVDNTDEIQSEKAALESFDSSITLCNLDWVRRHLEAFPQILKTGSWHWPPLYRAVGMNHLELAQILLDAGADPNQFNAIGNLPLHLAATSDSAEMIELLVRYGADIEKRDEISKSFGSKGYTALARAARNGRAQAVRALTKAGAKMEYEREELSALHLAVSGAYIRKPVGLESRFTLEGRPIDVKVQPCVPGNTEVIDALIEAGAATDFLYFDRTSVLDTAIQHFDLPTIRHLLTKHKDRFDVNAPNLNRELPLAMAIRSRVAASDTWGDRDGTIAFLVESGADTSRVPQYVEYLKQLKQE